LKKFCELTPHQRERAVEEALRRILLAVTDGGLRFNDLANANDLQARIDAARVRSEQHEQDFTTAVLLTCSGELGALARMSARDAIYTEGETVICVEDL
jgi:hypothetical protein